MKKERNIKRKSKDDNGRKLELYGLALMAAALFMLAAYFGLPTGSLGSFTDKALRYSFGLGAMAVPLVLLVMGAGLCLSHRNPLFNLQALAVGLIYVCVLGMLHHLFIPLGEELAPEQLPNGGGLIGGALLSVLRKVAGSIGALILLIAGFFASIVLTGKLSVSSTAAKAGSGLKSAGSTAKDRILKERMFKKRDSQVFEDLYEDEAENKPRSNASSSSGIFKSGKLFNGGFGSSPKAEAADYDNGLSVYDKDEFASFTQGIKKESVFKQILHFGSRPKESTIEVPYGSLIEGEEAEQQPITPSETNRKYHGDGDYSENEICDADSLEGKKTPELMTVHPEEQNPVVLRPRIIRNNYEHKEQELPENIITGSLEKPAAAQLQTEPAAEVKTTKAAQAVEDFEPGYVPEISINQSDFEATYGSREQEEAKAVAPEADTEVDTSYLQNVKITDTVVEAAAGTAVGAAAGTTVSAASLAVASAAVNIPAEVIEPHSLYKFPPLSLLDEPVHQASSDADEADRNQGAVLLKTLADFKIHAKIVGITRGPSVTRFELEPAPGVKVSSIVNLADDIALRLAAPGVRIEAPIPGKAAIGIEAPNIKNEMVYFKEVVDCKEVNNAKSKLCVGLGRDISGNVITADLAKMPHLLVAGSTGSGKSVCINTLITGILYKAAPEEVKLILVDPKVVELTNYNGIPHLLIPVVTDAKKAASALHWAVSEMERRYQAFADNRVREITAYNAQAVEKMPYIVIVIDEMSDLMMVAKVDVEEAILRLAQKARAAGIHLVLATQRPSVDVITGIVKANIPSRIAFAVSSQTDSRTILDMGGAEKLLGKGDMLFYPIGTNKPTRVQGAFVTDAELNRIVDFIKEQAIPVKYTEEVTEQALSSDKKAADASHDDNSEDKYAGDELFEEAVRLVMDLGQASSSMLQRRFRVGYTRAARLVDTMEELGIVGPAVGSKPRELIMTRADIEAKFFAKQQ